MARDISNEPMLEIYLYETGQLVNKLEQLLVTSENEENTDAVVNEIFRIMHTIKGNSMMMLFEEIGALAHAMEDLFSYVRHVKNGEENFSSMVDLVLESVDFIKAELEKVEGGQEPDGKATELIETIQEYLESLKFLNPKVTKKEPEKAAGEQKYYIAPVQASNKVAQLEELMAQSQCYKALLKFEEGCEMENVRAFSVVHNLKSIAEGIVHFPKDIVESDETVFEIRNDGFCMCFQSEESLEVIKEFFTGVAFADHLDLEIIELSEYLAAVEEYDSGRTKKEIKVPRKELEKDVDKEVEKPTARAKEKESEPEQSISSGSRGLGNFISVGVGKVDKLMDLIGELVVSESMVVNNPDLRDLELVNFEKSVRQHRLIIKELQDVVMSIRMVPVELTFQKMHRIVRDMSKKMNKDVRLEIIGAETEVDKSVIEQIGDPLMHIIRNSIDHGIEEAHEREEKGKDPTGTVKLEARQAGGHVYITIKDDGKGMDANRILDKADGLGLLMKPRAEYLEKEAYQFIFAPGFSTKEAVTEYSGRGVGLDVVTRNIEKIGGSVYLDSQEGRGSEFVFKIPLSLAILEGMLMQVGRSTFAVPITSIKESLSIREGDIIEDTDGNEMILIRGKAQPIVRLHSHYGLETDVKALHDGILVLIENDTDSVLLFADAILGEQQLVVKPLSNYLNKVQGLGGCALLGDGRICLIVDPAGLTQLDRR